MTDMIDIILCGRMFKKFMEHTFSQIREEYGLKQIDIEVLSYISCHAGATASDIYRQRGLNKGQISLSMDTLCKKKYLQAAESREDRRYIMYQMTESGKRVVNELLRLRAATEERILAGVSKDELAVFERMACKIYDNMKTAAGG